MPSQHLNEFLANNEKFVAAFKDGDKPLPPARKTAIVACMDARLHPESTFGLNIGDCHVIRNAGGRVTSDAIRSLILSQQLLGTNEVYIVHHTDCGMLTFTNDIVRGLLKERLGADASEIDFVPFNDLEKSVIEDMAVVKNSPFISPGTPIVGTIYDVKTGKITVVGTDETPAK